MLVSSGTLCGGACPRPLARCTHMSPKPHVPFRKCLCCLELETLPDLASVGKCPRAFRNTFLPKTKSSFVPRDDFSWTYNLKLAGFLQGNRNNSRPYIFPCCSYEERSWLHHCPSTHLCCLTVCFLSSLEVEQDVWANLSLNSGTTTTNGHQIVVSQDESLVRAEFVQPRQKNVR